MFHTPSETTTTVLRSGELIGRRLDEMCPIFRESLLTANLSSDKMLGALLNGVLAGPDNPF
jgi:hypothetical protein